MKVGREVGENVRTAEIGNYSGQFEVSQRTQQAPNLGGGRRADQYDSMSVVTIKVIGEVCVDGITAQSG